MIQNFAVEIHELPTEVDDIAEIKLVAMMTRFDATKQPAAIMAPLFVGCVGLHLGERSSCIRQLFVAPKFRRLGVGRRLVERCCQLADVYGSETLGLQLAPNNEGAWQFYKRLGFLVAYEYQDGPQVCCKQLSANSAASRETSGTRVKL